MTTILWWLIQNTCTVALLVPIVALVCRSMRNRPALQHALWLVVLVKFVTPPFVAWPWSAREMVAALSANEIADPSGQAAESTPAVRGPVWPAGDLPAIDRREPAGSSLEPIVSEDPIESGVVERPSLDGSTETPNCEWPTVDKPETFESEPNHSVLLQRAQSSESAVDSVVAFGQGGSTDRSDGSDRSVGSESVSDGSAFAQRMLARAPVRPIAWGVFVVWVAGALVSAIGLARRVMRQWRLVRCATEPPPHLSNELRRMALAMRVRPVPARVVGGIATPLVWCVGWLRLLWPERLASASDVARCRGVIAHELAHVRRGDHWVAWLELAAGIVWWWNPLFWLVRSRLREMAEIACDATALSVLPDGRRAYAEIFLELSSTAKTRTPAPVLGMSTGARRTFERRLTMMLCDKVPCKIPLWGFVAVLLMALVTLPSWSLGQLSSPSGVGSALDSSGGTSGSATQPAPVQDPLAPPPLFRDDDPAPQDSNVSVGSVAFSPDGRTIAVAGADGRVAVKDAQSGEVLRTLGFAPGQPIHSLAFSPDGRYIAGILAKTRISIVDVPSGKVLWVTEIGEGHVIDSLQFSPDARLVTVIEGSGLGARTWQLDANMGKVLRTFYGPAGDSDSGRVRSDNDPAGAQSPPQDSKGDAQRPIEQRVRVLEEKLDEILKELRNLRAASGPQPPSTGSIANRNQTSGIAGMMPVMATSPDGKFKAGPLSPGHVAIFDAATGTLVRKFDTGFTDPVQSMEFTPDGKRLLVKSDGRLTEQQLNVDTGNLDYTVFSLKYVAANSVQDTLQQVFRGESVQVSVDARTNTIIAKGTPEQLSEVKSLIKRLDAPSEAKKGDVPSAGPTADMGAPLPTSTRSNRITPYGSVATQLDLVNLGTAMIEARGAVRLAQAKFDRVKKLGASGAVPSEETLEAEINLDTAQRKLDLLTGIAQSALDLGRTELTAAEADLSHISRLVQKGFAPKSQVEQAEAQHLAAQAKLKLLHSLLGPTVGPTPASGGEKQ
jgi:beta-lactamase regulating signal transducer with metallopeptidase domain/WD40 repeat protein